MLKVVALRSPKIHKKNLTYDLSESRLEGGGGGESGETEIHKNNHNYKPG
jgi:hypothetical protein